MLTLAGFDVRDDSITAKWLEKSHKMIEASLGVKPIIVELAQAVEEGPEYFKFWDPTKLKEVSFKKMCEFPLTAWGHSLYDKLDAFQEFAREHIKIYNLLKLSDSSTQKLRKHIGQLEGIPLIQKLVIREDLKEGLKWFLKIACFKPMTLQS